MKDDVKRRKSVQLRKTKSEYQAIDLEALEWQALGPVTPAKSQRARKQSAKSRLERAHDALAAKLIVKPRKFARSAESGTNALGFENVVGVSPGAKLIEGKSVPCVTVYVVQKASEERVEKAALVPKEIDGVPTDVVEVGEFRASQTRGFYRPMQSGVSMAHFQGTDGTGACLVRKGNALFILSNRHVLAPDQNAQVRDFILQPAPADGGTVPTHVIGRLSAASPIHFGDVPNKVDCAVAQTNRDRVDPRIFLHGPISYQPERAYEGMPVLKVGRTTGKTRGIVRSINAVNIVTYGAQSALFVDQILIQSSTGGSFAASGDSGALIIAEETNRPVGLLFGASSTSGFAIANDIGTVLEALQLDAIVATF